MSKLYPFALLAGAASIMSLAVINLASAADDTAAASGQATRARPASAAAEKPTTQAPTEPPTTARAASGRPIVLGPDDKPAFADPPAGFDAERDSIPHGKLELAEYDSKTVGTRRKMLIYLPPGYSSDRKYPVLYLLHGLGAFPADDAYHSHLGLFTIGYDYGCKHTSGR